MVVPNNQEPRRMIKVTQRTVGYWAESSGGALSGLDYGKQQRLRNQTYLALNSESLVRCKFLSFSKPQSLPSSN